MPTTPLRNLLYRAALPVAAPSPRGQMTHASSGHPIQNPRGYEHLLRVHHVLGSTLYLKSGERFAQLDTSVAKPCHHAAPDTLYRVASITKTATALVTLRVIEGGAFTLDTPVRFLLPGGEKEQALQGITVRHLLSHTSGLRDLPAADQALSQGKTWHDVLAQAAVRAGESGARFSYCNFGFGLLGCILENACGQTVDEVFRKQLFDPLGMEASLSASKLDSARMMPLSRVLPYHAGQDVVMTELGRQKLLSPDPERHFGYTAGAMYTTAASLSLLLSLIANQGVCRNTRLLKSESIAAMTSRQATYGTLSPGMHYGLGLVLLHDPKVSAHRIIGHQGFAYGCVDGAFLEEETLRQVIFLNGGCSEARTGRLGLANRDVLRWALGKELPSWT